MSQSNRTEFEVRVSSADAEDGYIWVAKVSRRFKGSGGTRMIHFKCSMVNCMVEKDVDAEEAGQYVIRYRGAHCHPRPFLHQRGQQYCLRCVVVFPSLLYFNAYRQCRRRE